MFKKPRQYLYWVRHRARNNGDRVFLVASTSGAIDILDIWACHEQMFALHHPEESLDFCRVAGLCDWAPWFSEGLIEVEKLRPDQVADIDSWIPNPSPARNAALRGWRPEMEGYQISVVPATSTWQPIPYLYAVLHKPPNGQIRCQLGRSASAFISPLDVWAEQPEAFPMREHGEQLTVSLLGHVFGPITEPTVPIRRISKTNPARVDQMLPNGLALAQARNEARKLRDIEARIGIAGRFAEPALMTKTIEVYQLQEMLAE